MKQNVEYNRNDKIEKLTTDEVENKKQIYYMKKGFLLATKILYALSSTITTIQC